MIKRITVLENEEFLRQISKEVDFLKDDYKQYIKDLKEYCQNAVVYALAPVQIGIPKRIIYIKNTSSDMANNSDSNYSEEIIYINPIIKKMYGHTRFLEGCNSCKYQDNKYAAGVIDRPYKIDIEYFDIDGNNLNKTIEGFESTIFCHEYDHLNGILHIDRSKTTLMTLDEMKEYRNINPYNIISKEESFNYK